MSFYDEVVYEMTLGKMRKRFHPKPLGYLKDATPIDITDCYDPIRQLYNDLHTDVNRYDSIPKKPPFVNTWLEWRVCEPAHNIDATVGVLAHDAGGSVFMQLFHKTRNTQLIGVVNVLAEFVFLDDQYMQLAEKDRLHQQWDDGSGQFEMQMEVELYRFFLSAFAMLNCRNVIIQNSDEPVEVRKRRHIRQGCPEKKQTKVLRLKMPGGVFRSTNGNGDGDGGKKSLHICRGHFKNLQNDRYKEKGWHWWPAHWRGSAGVGEVDKTYKLESE